MLLEQICHGATSYKEIKERAGLADGEVVAFAARSRTSSTNTRPSGWSCPTGARRRSSTTRTAAPTIAARIQDLYGVTGELRIAGDRIPLVIQVLAPNHRPIQITQNLATFWKESYPKIKQELAAKISEARVAVKVAWTGP